MEEKNAIDGYRNAPHNASDNYPRVDRFVCTSPQKPVRTINIPNSTSYPNSLIRTGYENHNNMRATLPNDYKPNPDLSRPKTWNSDGRLSEDE